MPLPNKIFSYSESSVAKFPLILSMLQNRKYKVAYLYEQVRSKFSDISEFMEVLDYLFALGRISFDENAGELEYVG